MAPPTDAALGGFVLSPDCADGASPSSTPLEATGRPTDRGFLCRRPHPSRTINRVAEGLFVGDVADAGDPVSLRAHGVSSVVSLTFSEPDGGFPDDVDVVREPLMDGPRIDGETFESAVTWTVALLGGGDTVLVHCSRGASRSPSVAAVALAVARIAERRLAVDPHDAVVRRAAAVHRELRGSGGDAGGN